MTARQRTIVGLTGGIGSGKSAAAEIFTSLGITVIDADTLAREVVEPGQPALAEIAAHFGAQVLTAEGKLDRALLRSIVFNDDSERIWLERLLHPKIGELLQTRLNEATSAYVILESPLLLETQQHELVDRVLVIDVSEELQLSRALVRDGSDAKTIRSIIDSQMNREDRLSRADDIVLNEDSLSR